MRCWLVACVCVWAGGASADDRLDCRFDARRVTLSLGASAALWDSSAGAARYVIDGKPATAEWNKTGVEGTLISQADGSTAIVLGDPDKQRPDYELPAALRDGEGFKLGVCRRRSHQRP